MAPLRCGLERNVRDIADLTGQHEESGEPPRNGQREAPADPLAAALERGERARKSILAAQGELLGVAEVAARLDMSPDEVLKRQERGRLLALPLDDGTFGFPSWQFAERGLLPGLDTVFRNIGVDDPWMQAAYFLSGELRLDGRTPLEMLQRGEVEAVRRAAAAYGEQSAS
jgi:hypothetical protein